MFYALILQSTPDQHAICYNLIMRTHRLRLATTPFNSIVSGTKTIESRLFDEKRQLIQLVDMLIFVNRDATNQTATAGVVGLLRYETFHELFSRNDLAKFGGENVDWLEKQISEFYSDEQQKQTGVVGIEFELV